MFQFTWTSGYLAPGVEKAEKYIPFVYIQYINVFEYEGSAPGGALGDLPEERRPRQRTGSGGVKASAIGSLESRQRRPEPKGMSGTSNALAEELVEMSIKILKTPGPLNSFLWEQHPTAKARAIRTEQPEHSPPHYPAA